MAILDKDAFSFIWRIENFSMCPYMFEERLTSNFFLVNGTKWALYLYPRGWNEENCVECFLTKRILSESDKEGAVTDDCELILHSEQAKKEICPEKEVTSEKHFVWNFYKFCLRDDILNRRNGYLLNDTLTIECRIRDRIQKNEKILAPISKDLNLVFSDSSLQKEMLTTAARDEFLDFQTHFASNHYTIRTRIPVGRTCVMWPIRRFGALRPDQRLTIPVITSGEDTPSFALTLYLSEGSIDVQIEIRIEESSLKKRCFVKCRITAVNDSAETQFVAVDEHFFEPTAKNDVWKFPTFLQTGTLKKEKYFDATEGILNLRCEFAFSTEGCEFHGESSDSVPFSNRFPKPVESEFNNVQNMCKQVYEEGRFSDFTLRIGSRTFKAHKNLLSARSPVFTAMFETNMREHETGIMDITDYDPDTVEGFLTFIYTNSLEDLQLDKAMKLYSMADKYQVLSLKLQCSNHLKSTLCVSNVCEVLTFADLHQDQNLLDYVQKYIQLHSEVILRSELWKDLMNSNLLLASRVMLDLLTGELDHL